MGTETKQRIVMICTNERGGMRAVVEGYRADGLFSGWDVILLQSHVEGSLAVRLITAIKAYSRFVWMLLNNQVSLVHCHSSMRGSFWRKSLFALTARVSNVEVIFHLHGSEMKTFVSGQPAVLQRLISWILEKQSVVVVLSDSWLHYLNSISPKANVQILPNYVNLADLSSRTDDHAAEVNVLFLGVVGTRKGIYDLLPAFKEALLVAPALRLIIGGNGEVDKAEALALELGISEWVTFAGWVSGEDKIALLRKADIYVLPSYNEGLPVSLLDAMSWQIPIVSTRAGGIPDLINDGIDGLLINAGDRHALTEAIVKLSQDEKFRMKIGIAGRNKIETLFSKQVVLPKLENMYRSLLNRGQQ